MRYKDLSGNKYGRLTVIKLSHKVERKDRPGAFRYFYLCKCDCGNECKVCGDCLKNSHVSSCGCYKRDVSVEKCTKHGLRYTRVYKTWLGMRGRCYNSNTPQYKYYGARGIKVCDEWKDDFVSFYNWAMANGYADNLTIDRIDVNGDYCPSNCRWATYKQQANNRRNTPLITYQGKTQSIKNWCEELNLEYRVVFERITRWGWNAENAFNKPKRKWTHH